MLDCGMNICRCIKMSITIQKLLWRKPLAAKKGTTYFKDKPLAANKETIMKKTPGGQKRNYIFWRQTPGGQQRNYFKLQFLCLPAQYLISSCLYCLFFLFSSLKLQLYNFNVEQCCTVLSINNKYQCIRQCTNTCK